MTILSTFPQIVKVMGVLYARLHVPIHTHIQCQCCHTRHVPMLTSCKLCPPVKCCLMFQCSNVLMFKCCNAMFSHTAGGRVQGQGDATTPAPPADGAYQPVNRYFTVESPVPRSHQHQHRAGLNTLELSTNFHEVFHSARIKSLLRPTLGFLVLG